MESMIQHIFLFYFYRPIILSLLQQRYNMALNFDPNSIRTQYFITELKLNPKFYYFQLTAIFSEAAISRKSFDIENGAHIVKP